jgi:hypothetical protein
MKLFVKLMLFVVVAALAAPFVLKGPNGAPLMSLDGIRMPEVSLPDLGEVRDTLKAGVRAADEEPANVTEVFKWRDDEGVWHFSDKGGAGRSV